MSTRDMMNTIIAIGGAGSVLVTASTWLFVKVRKALTAVQGTLRKINNIHETLGPNGGASMYDRVCRIDDATCRISARQKGLASAMNIGEAQVDDHGYCVSVNDVVCRRTGRPESDFIGRNWQNVVHADDRDRITDEWADAVANQRDFISDLRWTCSEGEVVRVRVSAKPVFDGSNKKLNGWIATILFKED